MIVDRAPIAKKIRYIMNAEAENSQKKRFTSTASEFCASTIMIRTAEIIAIIIFGLFIRYLFNYRVILSAICLMCLSISAR